MCSSLHLPSPQLQIARDCSAFLVLCVDYFVLGQHCKHCKRRAKQGFLVRDLKWGNELEIKRGIPEWNL